MGAFKIFCSDDGLTCCDDELGGAEGTCDDDPFSGVKVICGDGVPGGARGPNCGAGGVPEAPSGAAPRAVPAGVDDCGRDEGEDGVLPAPWCVGEELIRRKDGLRNEVSATRWYGRAKRSWEKRLICEAARVASSESFCLESQVKPESSQVTADKGRL